ncbi:hypothetical protein VISI1226_22912 [Vibrio sinaloensis DSM 21326]|uniref:ABM domain-containing protein n=1 Tax=Vibrio sinaloensis DSM 21326 TaxID=945550 RepID=E8MC24_PHOS4|nr:putative quinol monooxygenase [Vibrio sinaloensis]EGA68428.1 hypothetical protein VISI1226_22912 [Vibrio sinaloensis DSM 21326]
MIHLTATFQANQGAEKQLQSLLTAMLEPTRKESGCVMYRLLQDSNNVGRFTFQEQFTDQQAFDFHCQQPHFLNLLNQLEGVISADPEITFYHELEG